MAESAKKTQGTQRKTPKRKKGQDDGENLDEQKRKRGLTIIGAASCNAKCKFIVVMYHQIIEIDYFLMHGLLQHYFGTITRFSNIDAFLLAG